MAKTPQAKSFRYNALGGGAYSSAKGQALAWESRFDGKNGTAPPATYFSYEVGDIRNEEAQYYQAGNLNAKQVDGMLEIECRNESVGGMSYTSACVITKDFDTNSPLFTFETGAVEIRAKFSTVQGDWCALWFQGMSGPWPDRGELDLVEVLGHTPGSAFMGNVFRQNGSTGVTEVTGVDHSVFHVYRVEVTDASIKTYLDGVLKTTYNNPNTGVNAYPFGTGYPIYLMMNFAIGGTWGGTISGSFPRKMYVDWVRYYKAVS